MLNQIIMREGSQGAQGWECTIYSFASIHAAHSNALTSLYTEEGALEGPQDPE